jgi:hypothetical protein
MAFLSRCGKGVLLAVLLSAAAGSAAPLLAAPFHDSPGQQRNHGRGNDNAGPRDEGHGRCTPGQDRAFGQGGGDCNQAPGSSDRRNGPRRPGSSAFGLQFDFGYD